MVSVHSVEAIQGIGEVLLQLTADFSAGKAKEIFLKHPDDNFYLDVYIGLRKYCLIPPPGR